MKIRINLKDGNAIDLDAPENFSLVLFVQAIRAAGYWINETIYVPVENIFSMHRVDQEGKPVVKGTLQ